MSLVFLVVLPLKKGSEGIK